MKRIYASDFIRKAFFDNRKGDMDLSSLSRDELTIPFIYDDIKGEFIIKDLIRNKKDNILILEYEGKESKIKADMLLDGRFGHIVSRS